MNRFGRPIRESTIEDACGRLAKSLGWWHRKFKSPGKRSAPDRIFAKNGRVFFVEFKAPGKEPTELQLLEHEDMRAAGLLVFVCDSVQAFKSVLERLPYLNSD